MWICKWNIMDYIVFNKKPLIPKWKIELWIWNSIEAFLLSNILLNSQLCWLLWLGLVGGLEKLYSHCGHGCVWIWCVVRGIFICIYCVKTKRDSNLWVLSLSSSVKFLIHLSPSLLLLLLLLYIPNSKISVSVINLPSLL